MKQRKIYHKNGVLWLNILTNKNTQEVERWYNSGKLQSKTIFDKNHLVCGILEYFNKEGGRNTISTYKKGLYNGTRIWFSFI